MRIPATSRGGELSRYPCGRTTRAAAVALAEDDDPELVASRPQVQERLEKVAKDVALLQATVNLLTARRDKIRLNCSQEIAKEAEQQQRKLTKPAIAAAADLSKAYTSLMRFREDLEADGFILGCLPTVPSHVNQMGRWDVPTSRIHQLLDEATSDGYVNGEYKSRPRPQGPHDGIPEGAHVECVAAGPDGIARVNVRRGGKLEVVQKLYEPEPAGEKR